MRPERRSDNAQRRPRRLQARRTSLFIVAAVGIIIAAARMAELRLPPAPALADDRASELWGTVTRVADGDTVTLRVPSGETHRLRLAEIDAPERAQPYGPESRRALAERVQGRRIRAEVVDTDRYGRLVVDLWAGELHVNAAMVRGGHAWAYTRYARSLRVVDLENEAREAGRGLWALPLSQRDPPWEWRRRQREGAHASPPSDATTECGSKTRCSQMTSCAEARHHLARCGLSKLDGDGDGIPCETLCR